MSFAYAYDFFQSGQRCLHRRGPRRWYRAAHSTFVMTADAGTHDQANELHQPEPLSQSQISKPPSSSMRTEATSIVWRMRTLHPAVVPPQNRPHAQSHSNITTSIGTSNNTECRSEDTSITNRAVVMARSSRSKAAAIAITSAAATTSKAATASDSVPAIPARNSYQANSRPQPAVALALAVIALMALPLLHLLRHVELAAHGFTAVLAGVTAAALATWQFAVLVVARKRRQTEQLEWQLQQQPGTMAVTVNGPGTASSVRGAFVLPLPMEVALQPAFLLLLLLPLVVSAAAAVFSPVAKAVGPPDVAVVAVTSRQAWCWALLLHTAALLIPSPGPCMARGRAKVRRVYGLSLAIAMEGLRVALMGIGLRTVQDSTGPQAAAAAAAAVAAGAFWALHTAGVLSIAVQSS
ncbi:hypothetical protein Vretimale_12550 [Volvox reticuliferus]|uniref:Uncharacterized protein n=1 Tax=Volvox reticuliferus TaxID=1737510 RepID=A0A8J4GIM7_9CHLO|nr:hypothetical protein Vretifemale_9169 [Volvox reticuliferus]GIM08541.1 hypothetical protein Vretimale_12550 [Volvox reticuliferus]